MTAEARCVSGIHFRYDERGLLEVKCSSRRCGHGRGQVVFHYYDPESLKLVDTQVYKDPASLFESQREKV